MHQPESITLIGRSYEISYLHPIRFETVYTGLGMIRDSTYIDDALGKLYLRSITVSKISFAVGSNIEYRAAFIAIGI